MDISLLLSNGILAVSGALTILGLILKYRTGTSSEIIACVLAITSFIIWSIIGLVQQLTTGNPISWIFVLFERGLNFGIVSVCLSVFGWDLGHGIYRYIKDKKGNKQC